MKKTSLALLLATLSAASVAQTGAADVKLKRLQDLESCLQAYAPERCLESLEAYVARKPGEAYQAGKAARLNFRPWAGLRFFEKALQGKQASQVCADQDFALSMLSALELPTDYPDQQRAVKLLEGRCGSTVLPFLEKELQQPSPSTYLLKSLCPTLLKQGRKVVACQPEAQAPQLAPAELPDKLPKVNPAEMRVEGSVKVYAGPEGAQLYLAPLQEKGLYLLKVAGVGGEWEGRVLLHQEDSKGLEASDFWTEYQGRRFVTIARRENRGYSAYTVSLPGRSSAVFGYSLDESRKASAQALLEEWRRQVK